MQTPSTLSIWLGEQAWPIAIIAVVVCGILLTLYVSARSRRAKMNEMRAGITEDTFVQELGADRFDRAISRETYRYLQERQNVSFPIRPEDDLDHDLGLDSEDVEQSIQELLFRTERLYQPGLKHTPIVTVTDLIRFIQASPRLSELAA